MNSRHKNIREKFSDFQPEASQEAINKGWEEIKYFLPKEKKRRILFTIPRKYGWHTAVLGLVVVLLALGMLVWNSSVLPADVTVLKTEIQQEEKVNNLSSSSYDQKQLPINPVGSPSSNNHHDLTPNSRNSSSENTQPTTNQKLALKGTNEISPGQKHETIRTSKLPESEKSENEVTGETKKMDTKTTIPDSFPKLKPILLAGLPYQPTDPDINPQFTERKKFLFKPKKTEFRVELIGGINQAVATVNTSKFIKLTSAYGAGLYFFPQRNLFLHGQFVTSSAEARQIKRQTNNIYLNRIVIPNSSITSSFNDSIITRYKRFHTDETLQANRSYHIGFGAGYRFLNYKGFSVGAAIMINLRQTNYVYTRVNIIEPETLKHVTVKGDPFTNFVSEMPTEKKESYPVKSAGLTPVIFMSYDVTKHLALVLKPEYSLNLSNKSFDSDEKKFSVKHKNFYALAGVHFIF